ncbi:DHPS: dihydropteroate synthase [Rubrobacter radiotolerans]|uniref:Dihydropteroate synthase n=1 Tax=Rubrobacter radiotolerans TaxID=42256 RepID=A0A023X5A6_RUBRA|nr:dihydropteroate synthase [Rubrobacter radiotolerans]AHY47254.1 DHPS: dihydropteroate synthase [Rubrobacter radiotolerans]MDX5894659.1 dihydropteroate synthase [Rubrobacter radiotolerans]SMC06491.1 dihydropteroate synthase [Rubrobacter radiotolerans DSM 5868]
MRTEQLAPGGGTAGRFAGPAPVLLGILNTTPDSFSDGGFYLDRDRAVAHALDMLDAGAEVVDVGGESTRPGSAPVAPEEEVRRVVPVIRDLLAERPGTLVSIDTYRAATARAALEAGAAMVNDVSAGTMDAGMLPLVAEAGCPVVLMHMKGEPKTMQLDPRYKDVVREVREFLLQRVRAAERAGVAPENVVLDPGIGFGKTLVHNLTLLRDLEEISALGFPVILGTSRKSFIGRLSGVEEASGRVFGTVATSVMAYERGARLFRVHDVRENREALAVAAALGDLPDSTV